MQSCITVSFRCSKGELIKKRLNSTEGLPDQAVAANFDYVFITMSLNRDFHMTKLERYLTTAWQSGGTPVILLTKADLCKERNEYVEKAMEVAKGVDIYCVSSKIGEGIKEMDSYLQTGKTCVLLGSSGVGKSSLVNLLMGKKEMETGTIRGADAQGRHTTTYKQCIFLPEEILLPDGQKVSFSDCQHKREPGCAVKIALEDGSLSYKRWENYQNIKREEQYCA